MLSTFEVGQGWEVVFGERKSLNFTLLTACTPVWLFEGSPNTCCCRGRKARFDDQKPVVSELKATRLVTASNLNTSKTKTNRSEAYWWCEIYKTKLTSSFDWWERLCSSHCILIYFFFIHRLDPTVTSELNYLPSLVIFFWAARLNYVEAKVIQITKIQYNWGVESQVYFITVISQLSVVHSSVTGLHGTICYKDGDLFNPSFKAPCH